MEGDRRRVLVLAYYFPPVGGAGVQRTLKFVKYLARLGWDATVVSTRSRAYGARDPSLLQEVPQSTRVVRTAALPLARYLGYALYRLHLMRVRAFVLWPDGGLGWMPFAFLAAMRAVRRDRPDVLFSTSSPYGSHLVALLVARLTGLPWVADFRDEWAANPHLADQPRVLAALSERAELAIARRAARIVVAADYFTIAGPRAADPRRVEIVNGVDEEDLCRRRLRAAGRTGSSSRTSGSIYDLQDPSSALRALAALVAARRDRRRAASRCGSSATSGSRDSSRRPGIRVEATGYVEHARAIAEMRSATVLLLYVPRRQPRALGEAVRVPRAPAARCSASRGDGQPGEPARPRLGCRRRGRPARRAAIEEALLELWRRWQEGGLPDQEGVRARALERYSRRANAVTLARVLEQACRG